VGLKPSAIQGKARLRGLERSNCSKIISPRLCKAKPACAGWTGRIQTYRIRVDPSYPCRSVFYSSVRGAPACAGYSRQTFIRADPSHPCRSVFYSSVRGAPACTGWSRSISQPPSIADCDHSFTNADGDERKASTCVDARLKAHPISGATSVAAPCSVERRSLFSKRPQHTRRQHPQQRSSAEIE
jgi:hypothetical protein